MMPYWMAGVRTALLRFAHGADLWAGAETVGNGSSTVLLTKSGEPRYQATGARSTTKIATIHQILLRIASLPSMRFLRGVAMIGSPLVGPLSVRASLRLSD